MVNCSECRFFRVTPDTAGDPMTAANRAAVDRAHRRGECRRYPPRVFRNQPELRDELGSAFPPVDGLSGCGEAPSGSGPVEATAPRWCER